MNLLSLDSIRKNYGVEPVLDGVSFQIFKGDKIGLVGPNGTGKTTLLNIAAGRLDADAGEIGAVVAAFLEDPVDARRAAAPSRNSPSGP